MSNFYEAFEREKNSDIRHYGVKGMKWGVINKADMKGGKSGGIVRGMQKSSGAGGMESWDLKDKVERMKLESDYRKLTEEEETYAVVQAEKIRQAKIEKVMSAVKTVGAVAGTAGTILGVVKSISSWAKEADKKPKTWDEALKRNDNINSHIKDFREDYKKSQPKFKREPNKFGTPAWIQMAREEKKRREETK